MGDDNKTVEKKIHEYGSDIQHRYGATGCLLLLNAWYVARLFV